MEGWILALVIVLSIVLGLLVIYTLGIIFLYALMRPKNVTLVFKTLLFLAVVGVCIAFGKVFHDFIAVQIGYFVPQYDLCIWDNIWWSLAFIVILLIIACIVRSISYYHINFNLIYATLGMIFVLLVYTLVYIIYIFRDKLWFSTLILLAIAVGMVLIILFLQYMSVQTMLIFMPFQFIFALDCVLLVICVTWMFVKFVISLYEWFSKK